MCGHGDRGSTAPSRLSNVFHSSIINHRGSIDVEREGRALSSSRRRMTVEKIFTMSRPLRTLTARTRGRSSTGSRRTSLPEHPGSTAVVKVTGNTDQEGTMSQDVNGMLEHADSATAGDRPRYSSCVNVRPVTGPAPSNSNTPSLTYDVVILRGSPTPVKG